MFKNSFNTSNRANNNQTKNVANIKSNNEVNNEAYWSVEKDSKKNLIVTIVANNFKEILFMDYESTINSIYRSFEFKSGISMMKSIPPSNDPRMIKHRENKKIIKSAMKSYKKTTKLNTLIGKKIKFDSYKPQYNNNKSHNISFKKTKKNITLNNNINYSKKRVNMRKRFKVKTGVKLNDKKLNDKDNVKLKVNEIDNGYRVSVLTGYDKYNSYYDIKITKWNKTPTLNDFLSMWEKDYGVTGMKSGMFRPDIQQKKLGDVIKNNITVDTKLKDLAKRSKTIDWLSYKPNNDSNNNNNIASKKEVTFNNVGKHNIMLTTNDSNSDSLDVIEFNNEVKVLDNVMDIDNNGNNNGEKYKCDSIVNLSKLFDNDNSEYDKMKWCLEQRGWILCEFPKKISYKITTASKLVYNAFNKYMKSLKNNQVKKEWKTICDTFGVINFENYKSVLRILTDDVLDILENEYPNEIIDSIYLISETMNVLSNKLINNKVFSEYIDKNNNNLCQLSGMKLNNDKILKFGMIDFVLYHNNKKLNKHKNKYKMLNNNINVDSHIDPGLFSISFIQISKGIELLNKYNNVNEWYKIDNYNNGKYGIIWLGKYAEIITNNKYKSGIHRVMYNDNKPRFTGWYEACVHEQISNNIIQYLSNKK